MPAYFSKIVRTLTTKRKCFGLTEIIDNNCVIILVQIIPYSKAHCVLQMLHIHKLYTRSEENFLSSANDFFTAVVVDVFDELW